MLYHLLRYEAESQQTSEDKAIEAITRMILEGSPMMVPLRLWVACLAIFLELVSRAPLVEHWPD